ncbi:hypothetical protein GQ53DRAFT_860979 [Thozetella sp. PMI_491]|nr:hypothetical protein GQ53DRAFT_860979 [Thozetella sp. PMI_491]
MDHKDGDEEEKQAFLSPALSSEAATREDKRTRKLMWYLRLALECAMAVSIAALLIFPASCKTKPSLSPVPTFPRKTYTFVQDKRYLHDDMFESSRSTLRTLHNWVELSSDARGYVQIKDPKSFGLGEPYTVSVGPHTDGPGYMVSVFHQLHCLSYIITHFQTGFAGLNLTEEVAHHSTHCFDYLRQSIMCAADTSLEGLTEAGPGWGSKHVCADYDALLAWANENGAMPWRNTLIPEEENIL